MELLFDKLDVVKLVLILVLYIPAFKILPVSTSLNNVPLFVCKH